MYNLLKDKKSEALAKRTLELQQMEGVVNIQRATRRRSKTESIRCFLINKSHN